MDETSTPEEKERLGLLYRIAMPQATDAAAGGSDPELLRTLLGDPLEAWEQGLSPFAPVSLIDALMATPGGHAAVVRSDIELIRETCDTGEDTRREGACGLMDAAFPIQFEGRVAGCWWMRHYFVAPVDDAHGNAIREATGLAEDALEALLADAVILTAHQEEQLLDGLRTLRDRVEIALHQHLRASGLTRERIQSERTIALGSLSSGVAHRFNNLLSIILGYSSYIVNREDVSEEAIDALRKISDAAQQGRRLTEEILAFVGSDVEEETTCHVHDVLNSILSLLQSQHSSHVQVNLALDAETDSVTAAPSNIHQLIFNLLTNAFDSMPKGGQLDIASRNGELSRDGVDAPALCLAITDSGGVADGDRDGADAQSFGFKIDQAHGIVGNLDGDVTISSETGEKTRVEVRLPVVMGAAPDTPLAEQSPRLVPSTIWVVDDDPIFREMCRQVLGDEGHRVERMESGSEMQERWNETPEPPDLMIIDFSMPEYNGLELCEWLQDQKSTVPVILVSGFAENHPDIHQALKIRKTYFLRKPFSYREVVDTVTVALGETLIIRA